jgi:hypothetical protein
MARAGGVRAFVLCAALCLICAAVSFAPTAAGSSGAAFFAAFAEEAAPAGDGVGAGAGANSGGGAGADGGNGAGDADTGGGTGTDTGVGGADTGTGGGADTDVDADTGGEVPAAIEITDIEVGDYKSSIVIGETVELTASVVPADAANQTIGYTSGDPAVAAVSSKGQIKGVARGETAIVLKAGKIEKSIPIVVTGAKTAEIRIGKDFLVLKPGGTYRIGAAALPAEASQALTYRSLNTSVAEVSGEGVIRAVRTGSTSVVISNGEMTAALSVIVNRTSAAGERGLGVSGGDGAADAAGSISSEVEHFLAAEIEQRGRPVVVSGADCPVITKAVLRALSTSGGTLTVEADEYAITVNGADILNPDLEVRTAIRFESEGGGICFLLNGGLALPGKITLDLRAGGFEGEYLYLFNESKNKYEKLDAKSGAALRLDEAGKYMLSDKDLSALKIKRLWIAFAAGAVAVFIIVFVVVRRRYWFW